MWIAEQGRRRPQADGTALVGQVTLPGDPAAVYLDGERRELPVFGPGGYIWRPARDQQVLVLKTGAAGEAPCVAGALCGDDREVSPGEVLIYSGGHRPAERRHHHQRRHCQSDRPGAGQRPIVVTEG